MSTPNKKLSTRPLRIDTPQSGTQPETTIDEQQDYFLLEEKNTIDSLKPVNHSTLQAAMLTAHSETSLTKELPESSKQDSSIQENRKQDSSQELKTDKIQVKDSKDLFKDSSKQETGKQETSLVEYKKVAMRLSATAVERLKQLRMETSIPYEILVDVMITHWDKLPEEIREGYLREAQQLRGERLIAGQQKTMETMQKRYRD